jgi:hypothetical protein
MVDFFSKAKQLGAGLDQTPKPQRVRDQPNVPDIPTLSEFIALTRKTGFSKSNRFMAIFNPPSESSGFDMKTVTLLCEEAAFAGKEILARPRRINAVTEYHAESVNYMGDSITFQFLLDSNWTPRRFMETWMQLCGSGKGESGGRGGNSVGFYNDYIGSIDLYALVPALGFNQGDAFGSPTTGDSSNTSILRGDLTGGIKANILNRTRKIADNRLDKLKTKVGSYIDPKAVDVLRDVNRVLNRYHGADDPNRDIPPEAAVWGMTLHECWPRQINVQQLSYQGNGSQAVSRMNVTFTFKWWEPHSSPQELRPSSDDAYEPTPGSKTVLDRINTGVIFDRFGKNK